MRARKLSDQKLKFKNSVILLPIIFGLVATVGGGFLFMEGMEGDWMAWNEYTAMTAAGSAFFIIGLFILTLGPRVHIYNFDKGENKIAYECKKLGKNKFGSYSLEEASKIIIAKEIRRRRNNSNTGGGPLNNYRVVYRYLLEFSNGARIQLGKKSRQSGVLAFVSGSTPKAISALSSFLDIPIEEPGIQEAISQVTNTFRDVMAGKTPDHLDKPEEPPKA